MIFYSCDDVSILIDEAVDTLSGEALRSRLAEILGTDERGYPTCSVMMATVPTIEEVEAIIESQAKHGGWCRSVKNPHDPVGSYFYTRDEERSEIEQMIKDDTGPVFAKDDDGLDSEDRFELTLI
jgi:hypothetical protein